MSLMKLCLDFVTIKILKSKIPGKTSYIGNLVNDVLYTSYAAHDVSEDILALAKLLKAVKCKSDDFVKASFSSKSVYLQIMFNKEKDKNIKSLEILQSEGIFKRFTLENIAGSGLAMKHLISVYKRGGEHDLYDLFKSKNDIGKPRVTNQAKVLNETIPKLAAY